MASLTGSVPFCNTLSSFDNASHRASHSIPGPVHLKTVRLSSALSSGARTLSPEIGLRGTRNWYAVFASKEAGLKSSAVSKAWTSVSCTRSLKQPSVVLTREKGKNGKLMKALAARGIDSLELPLIEHTHGPDRMRLPQILQEEDFEWVVVTSPEAAAVFLEGWQEANFPTLRLAVVGGGTAQAFDTCQRRDKLDIAFTPSKATAKVLAAEIFRIEGGSGKVLYPASSKASNDLETGLKERGYEVVRLNTYSTESVRAVDPHLLQLAVEAPVVTFASPTAVRAWVELVVPQRHSWQGAAACIGSTSAVAAQRAGLTRVYHPESPGIEGWVESIVEALKSTEGENAQLVQPIA